MLATFAAEKKKVENLKRKIVFIFFYFLLLPLVPNNLLAQSSDNPFELLHRMGIKPGATTVDSAVLNNPFDLLARPSASALLVATEKAKPAKKRREWTLPKFDFKSNLTPTAILQRLDFGVTTFILLTLAFFMTLLRGPIIKVFQAFANENAFNQIFREREGRGVGVYAVLYLSFLINLGFFLFYLLHDLQVDFGMGYVTQLGICVGAVIAGFGFKHLALGLIGLIFPVGREISRYNFIMLVFGAALGLLLGPINILLAYGSPEWQKIFIWGTIAVIGLVYAFRSVRSLWLAGRIFASHLFHFLLYICTVEIAPVLTVVKLILNQQ
jgi:hypothetical protein